MIINFINKGIDLSINYLMVAIKPISSDLYKVPVWKKLSIPTGGTCKLPIDFKDIKAVASYGNSALFSLSSDVIPPKNNVTIEDKCNTIEFSKPVKDDFILDTQMSVTNNSYKQNMFLYWTISDNMFAVMTKALSNSFKTVIAVEKSIFLSIGDTDYLQFELKAGTVFAQWTDWVEIKINNENDIDILCFIDNVTNSPHFKVL